MPRAKLVDDTLIIVLSHDGHEIALSVIGISASWLAASRGCGAPDR